MPYLKFSESEIYEVSEGTRVLSFAVRKKMPLKYGCASCRCGTCLVRVEGACEPMDADETALLQRLGFKQDEGVRLACRLVMQDEDLYVDLQSQETLEARDSQHDDDHVVSATD